MGLIRGLAAFVICAVFFPIELVAKANIALPNTDNWRKISVEGKQVPVVHIEALSKRNGAVIFIQGKEERRFEYKVLNYLRHALPEKGWSTLGINIPKSGETFEFVAAEKQLEQSVLMLKEEGATLVYVVLYGESAAKLLSHFINEKVRNITGIILVSAFAKKLSDYDTLIENIKTWHMYVFDIKAQYDHAFITEDFKIKNNIFNKIPSYYRSLTLIGARHDYRGSEAVLMRWIRGWMVRYAKKQPVVNRPDGLKQIPLI